MTEFLKKLQTLPEIGELVRRVEEGGCPAAVTGLQLVQRSCVGAAVTAGTERPAVFLCADEREERQLAGDLRPFWGWSRWCCWAVSGSCGPSLWPPGSGSADAFPPSMPC